MVTPMWTLNAAHMVQYLTSNLCRLNVHFFCYLDFELYWKVNLRVHLSPLIKWFDDLQRVVLLVGCQVFTRLMWVICIDLELSMRFLRGPRFFLMDPPMPLTSEVHKLSLLGLGGGRCWNAMVHSPQRIRSVDWVKVSTTSLKFTVWHNLHYYGATVVLIVFGAVLAVIETMTETMTTIMNISLSTLLYSVVFALRKLTPPPPNWQLLSFVSFRFFPW